MATILRQTTLWLDLERELPPGLKDVEAFLGVLSEVDSELVRALQSERGHGRDDHPVAALWNLLSVALYLRRVKFSELLGELSRNAALARLLGFREIGPNQYDLPSDSALSRFHTKLKSDGYLKLVEDVFKGTVAALAAENPEFGKNTALDASDVRTHAQPPRKARKEEGKEGSQEAAKEPSKEQVGEEATKAALKPSSDPAASWSVKTKIGSDAQGKPFKMTESTFGYKLYAVVDTQVPGVAALDVLTGKTSDQTMAIPMIEVAQENLPEGRMETVAMDKGFDSKENVEGPHELGIAAIVPVRDVPQNLEKLPREDREERLEPQSNIVYDRYTGEVLCYATENGGDVERRTMTYAGFEPGRDTHKFRCPLGAAAEGGCKAFHSCSAGSAGAQGKQVRIPMKTDSRRFAPIYPRSHRWRRLYNGRSAVERVNSYVKEPLGLERHCLRGKSAIHLRVLLASVTLNVRTLICLRQARVAEQQAA